MATSTEPRRSSWTDLPTDTPMPLARRKRIIGEHMMISRVELDADFSMPPHCHENEQHVVVLSGHLVIRTARAGVDGVQEHHLRANDVLVLPPNVVHSAHAIEDTVVLDVFSPVSEGTGLDQG